MWEGAQKVKVWVLGTVEKAMSRLSSSLTKIFIATPSDRQSFTQGNASAIPAGKVAWPVQPDTHDGCAIIASDAFFAEYDANAKRVWCLDDMNGKRHPGADPLVIGTNVEVLNGARRSGKGLVVRTAEYGTKGLYKNVFIHADGDLIAHHRQPDPPHNSSLVHDPGEGPDDWAGGLHYPLRVRAFIDQFCQHKTTGGQLDPLYAPLLNMTRNGDGTVAHGAASWARGEGVLSDEALGPLAPCDDGNRHLVGITHNGRRVYESGLNISTMKLGDPAAGIVYSPVEFDKTPRVPDGGGPFWMHTRFREDMQLKHGTLCNGEQPGTKIWQTPTMFTEWGPPPTEPPPPEVPPPTDAPPGVPIFPTPEEFGPAPPLPDTGSPGNKGPQDGSSTSAATPAEVEAPSGYGHPLPTGPEKPELGRKGTADDQEWLDRYGVTLKEFAESPITSHAINTAVHESATANNNASGARRWPTVKNQEAIVIYDADGRVIGRRQPAKGPGGVMYASSDVEKHDLYTTLNPISDTVRNAFYLGVFSAAHSGGVQVADGEIGLGSLKPDVAGIVKGARLRLDFSRSADPNIADMALDFIDEEGAAQTDRQLWLGGALRVPEVSAPGTPASGKVVIYAKADGKVYSKDDAGTETLMSSGAGGSGDMLAANNLSDLVSDDTSLANLITGATNRTPSVSTELPGYNFSGAATSGGALTIQQVFNLITGLTAETAPATNDELAIYDNTEGAANSITLANLFKVINSLTAETAPAYNDTLALYDASASNADAVTIANLFGHGKAVVVDYTGSGSSGKTVTLTGINRAHYLVVCNLRNIGRTAVAYFPAGATGTPLGRRWDGNPEQTWMSLDAPAAGTAQVLTINTTDVTVNDNTYTHRIFVVGTPT